MVSIAVTCLNERDGWVHPGLAQFLLAWAQEPVAGPIHFVQNLRPYHNARNEGMDRFRHDGTEWLFFIDNDTVPPVGVRDLVHHLEGRDILAVPCPFFRMDEGVLKVADSVFPAEDPLTRMLLDGGKMGQQGFVEVLGCGMACTLIHRPVLERMEPPYFRRNQNPRQPGEDLGFCVRARAAGFKVWTTIDYGRARHFKTVDLSQLY